MREPLALVLHHICDQSAQLSIALVDPFTGIDSWFDQDEGLVEETVIFLQRTIFLLQQNIPLELAAEDDLVAADKAEISQPYYALLGVYERHEIDLASDLLRSAPVGEGLCNLLYQKFVYVLDELKVPRQHLLESCYRPLLQIVVSCHVDGATERVVSCVPGLLPN